MTTQQKPHRGIIENWCRASVPGGYVIVGKFLDHPYLGKHGGLSITSLIVHEDGAEVETQNSRYTLGWIRSETPLQGWL